jgi:nucleotide-binding universal stress UspA family protein
MDIKRIVVPYDFSGCSAAALNYAARFAGLNAQLYIVHVDELLDADISACPPTDGVYIHTSAWDRRRRNIMRHLAKVVPHAPTTVYEHHCLAGYPVAEILSFAARVHADLIVMGSHGRTGMSRLLTGSVAEQVVRRSKCPVLVIKAPMIRHASNVPIATESPALRVGNEFAIK